MLANRDRNSEENSEEFETQWGRLVFGGLKLYDWLRDEVVTPLVGNLSLSHTQRQLVTIFERYGGTSYRDLTEVPDESFFTVIRVRDHPCGRLSSPMVFAFVGRRELHLAINELEQAIGPALIEINKGSLY